MKLLTIILGLVCSINCFTDQEFQDFVKLQNERMLELETIIKEQMNAIDEQQILNQKQVRQIEALEEVIKEQSVGIPKHIFQESVAFYAVLTFYETMPYNSAVVFNTPLVNDGDAYDSKTGVFTVPRGGDGLYYFSTFLLVDDAEYGRFDLEVNEEKNICTAWGDEGGNTGRAFPSTSCSGLAQLVEGDKVKLVYGTGSDETPLADNSIKYYCGLTGFRL